MATEHRVLYAIQTRIKVDDTDPILNGIANAVVLTANNKVPKNGAAFAVTLDLPTYQPLNLYPQDKNNNQISSSLLVGVTLYDAGKAGADDVEPKAKTAGVVGVPVNHPQRKHKFKEKREVKHQTFMFPGKLEVQHGFKFKNADESKVLTKLALKVYSVHEFYTGAHPKTAMTIIKRLLLDFA